LSDFLVTPGFLGTSATLRSDLTLVAMLLSVAMFNIGFILARKKKFAAHRWLQTGAVILSSLVVLVSMVTSYLDHILPGIPARLLEGDYAVTTLHAVIGAIALLFGVFVALRGNGLVPKALRFNNYKPYMRTAYGLYMFAALGGVIIYFIVFVLGI
jgi:uncharacterized membrane protein YozB (DUF420 family)